jgi:hypothetical protein
MTKHFSDALFEDLEENTLASAEELKRILPAYIAIADEALKNADNVSYGAKPKLESSGYILPNGALVNGPWEGHLEVQSVVLESLPEHIKNKVYNDDNEEYMDQMVDNMANLLEYIYKNVIRINSASDNTYILIDISQQLLTGQQLDTLKDWLDLVLYSNEEVDTTIYDSSTNQEYFCGILTLDNYDSRDIINLIKYTQTNKRPPSNAVWEDLKTCNHLDNVLEEASNYYRIEVFDENDEPQGGIFRGTNKLLKALWDADDWRYDNINEPLSKLEYATPYPEGLDDPKIKFAYKQNFYTNNEEDLKDLEAELSEVSWSMNINKIQRPAKVVYEDDTQIAYV